MIRTYQGNIYPWHCDQMGHMNVKFYVEKFDQANFQLFALLGIDWKYLKETNYGMAAIEQQIFYKKEVFPGENIFIESQTTEIKEKVMLNRHKMYKTSSAELAASCELTCVHMDLKKRSASPFPDFVRNNHKLIKT